MKSNHAYTELDGGERACLADASLRNHRRILLLVLVIASAVGLLYTAHVLASPGSFCDGAPYLYLTFHDGISNVIKYSRNGCLLSKDVLKGYPQYAAKHHYMEPRGIILNQYNNSPALYVADAYSTDSYLGIWGDCDSKGNRHFIKAALSTKLNAGIDHLYGMTFDAEQNVYTSSQHTDVVQRFYKDTFEPMPFPPYLEETYKSKAMTTFPGTFMQFELPTVHKSSKQGVRDLAHVHGEIWIANEDIDGVTLVDTFTGKVLDLIPVQNPIGLHYEPELGLVFVSCKVKHKQGHVLAISQKTHEVVRTYHSKKMQHPTGMVVYQGTLFVTNQKLREIVAFNVHTGKFKGVIVKKLPGAAEQLTLSPC